MAKYPELLRVSVCGAANDHRLGANEAPPAIISVFLGDQLQDIIDQLEKGGAKSTKQGGFMEIGVSVLPKLPKDAGDRNRTSPFAFTGNKFEFRAVGGSQSIAGPNTVLNTIVAESLDFIATNLEKAKAAGKDLNKAMQELLPGIIKESKKVLFNGDNYTAEWHKEAEKRGLPNLRNTVECLPVITRKDSVELFTKYKVYTERELQSRLAILAENYVKTVNIEAKLTAFMARTMILPAALRYQGEVANGCQRDEGGRRRELGAGGPAQVPDGHDHRVPEGDGGAGPRHRAPRRGRAAATTPGIRATRSCRRWPRCASWATSWRRSWPTTCGRCRPIGRCCSSSERQPHSVPVPSEREGLTNPKRERGRGSWTFSLARASGSCEYVTPDCQRGGTFPSVVLFPNPIKKPLDPLPTMEMVASERRPSGKPNRLRACTSRLTGLPIFRATAETPVVSTESDLSFVASR